MSDYFLLGKGIAQDMLDPAGFLATGNPMNLNWRESVGGAFFLFGLLMVFSAMFSKGRGQRLDAPQGVL